MADDVTESTADTAADAVPDKDEAAGVGEAADDLKNMPSSIMPGEITYVADPDAPPVPLTDHFRPPSALLAYIKTWIRRELMLKGAGHTEPERVKLNP